MDDEFQGHRFRVVHCRGALDSFLEAIATLQAKKSGSLTTQMISQITRLANGDRLPSIHFAPEADLPDGKKFYALKRIPIRGYIWQSNKYPQTYFISHYIHKKRDKLHSSDTLKVCENWRRIEEQNHER